MIRKILAQALKEAQHELPAASTADPAGMLATTVPTPVMPLTLTV